jgi:CDP-glucose 4,6-dehydratase
VVEYGTLEDYAFIQRVIHRRSPAVIFHLAAQTEVGRSVHFPWETWEANVRGTYNVLEASRNAVGLEALVLASSDKAYGDGPLPYRETQPLMINGDVYSASKAVADQLAQNYARCYPLPVRILRPGNIYGPGQENWTTLIASTAQRLLNGEPPAVRAGREEVLREYLYVEDACAAYRRVAEDAVFQGQAGLPPLTEPGAVAFNIGSGERLTTRQVVDRIVAALGRPPQEPEITPADPAVGKRELGDQYLDTTKFRERFPDWQPRSFEEGLQATLWWYEEFLSAQPTQPQLQRLAA